MEAPLDPDVLLKIGHDLRGPLGAIGTWAHVLGDGRADQATRDRALAAMAKDVRELEGRVKKLCASKPRGRTSPHRG